MTDDTSVYVSGRGAAGSHAVLQQKYHGGSVYWEDGHAGRNNILRKQTSDVMNIVSYGSISISFLILCSKLNVAFSAHFAFHICPHSTIVLLLLSSEVAQS